MKLFFELEALNIYGNKNLASVAFSTVQAISDFTANDVNGKLPDEFIENVKSIMLAGQVQYFCCEDRITLTARIEKKWAESYGHIVNEEIAAA